MKYYFKCPKCKNDERFSIPSSSDSGLGCALLIIGGLIPALIYADAVSKRVLWRKCGHMFRKPRLPRTSVSRFAARVIGIVILFAFVTSFLIAFPDLFSLIPDYETASYIEEVVVTHPKAIAVGFIGMVSALLLLAFITSWSSNWKAHSKLKKEFHTKATPYQFSVGEFDVIEENPPPEKSE